MKYIWLFIFLTTLSVKGQTQPTVTNHTENDSIKKAEFLHHLGNGYFPTKYFNFDLRYLIKYNQYEAIRTGIGGVTSSDFSNKYRLQGYTVYGFRDHRFKYSFGGGIRIADRSNTWISLFYTDDLEETGSSNFLTDKRFFQLFEPRLLNISLFHKHISKTLALEHQIHPKLLSEAQLSIRKISPTYNYSFDVNNNTFSNYDLSLVSFSMHYSPFSDFERTPTSILETRSGYPKFTVQYTKSFKDLFHGDFNFSKIDFRTIQQFEHKNSAITQLVLTAGLANGDIPLSHVYHAYPNNVNKETILQRFSVAGIISFETMYFNEFFSDKFATLILKHKLKPFQISDKFKPQLVLLTKVAIGSMDQIERHQDISFKTLDKGFSESGFEINKLLYGFGLSFAYRYGAYYLPKFEDNIAFKFTFNLTID